MDGARRELAGFYYSAVDLRGVVAGRREAFRSNGPR